MLLLIVAKVRLLKINSNSDFFKTRVIKLKLSKIKLFSKYTFENVKAYLKLKSIIISILTYER